MAVTLLDFVFFFSRWCKPFLVWVSLEAEHNSDSLPFVSKWRSRDTYLAKIKKKITNIYKPEAFLSNYFEAKHILTDSVVNFKGSEL